MSGFSTVIGFLFSFFIIAFIVSSTVIFYGEQISNQEDLIRGTNIKAYQNFNIDFNLEKPFYSSGRLNFDVYNLKDKLVFKKNNQNCFEMYLDNQYISSNYFVNIFKPIFADYSVIDKKEKAIVSFPTSKITSTKTLKFYSCEGIEKSIKINSTTLDWWNLDWKERKIINVENPSNYNLAEYQIPIILNSSVFDFNLGKENELRFVYPLKNSLVLDLTFDLFSQQLTDYSQTQATAVLGTTSAIETSDPSLNKNTLIINSLKFDGIDDIVTISANNNLLLNNSLTYSAWVKWSGAGNTFQNIITNGVWSNALRIVNDGGIYDKKVLFQLNIDGTVNYLYSNITLDTSSYHLITATYDGSEMKLYIDEKLVGNLTAIGNVIYQNNPNYIGSEGAGFYFNGTIDEVKIFNTDLSLSEISDLYYNNLRFRELDYFIADFDAINKLSTIYVKIPAISSLSNSSIHMYYDNRENIITTSNIEKTFSYSTPRRIGFVLSDRISASTGLNILSLYDNNSIIIGTNVLSLNEQVGTTITSANVNLNDEVKLKYLAQVEGNGQGDDIITPISWAGVEFLYNGFRNANDRFCMIAPFQTANIQIYDAGVLEYSGSVTSSGSCVTNDIATNAALRIISDVPILVSYYGSSSSQDAFVMYPATTKDLYGVPSRSLYVGAGPSGANLVISQSDGTVTSATLASNGVFADGGNGGGDGDANAYKISTNNLIGAIQQADGDGVESTVFVPKTEFGVKFGSNIEADYIAVVSTYSDANCSAYDNTGNLLLNQATGVGVNGVYKYNFGVGNDATFTNAGAWKLICSKPVWPYYENRVDNDDETNLLGHLQLRQYIYPEPIITIK